MDQPLAYSSSAETLASIKAWRKSSIRPDIMIMAPTREIGERELIDELAKASYDVQGFRDARRRHYVSRVYPYSGTDETYARFVDHAFDVSEITDGFYGVDNIDLTEWVGKEMEYDSVRWRRLLTYIADHPETDFVFLVYTTEEDQAHKIIDSISSNCGIAIALVKLDYPSVNALTRVFVEHDPERFADHRAYIEKRIQDLQATGWRMGYANVRSSALSALYEVSVGGDAHLAIKTVFDRTTNMGRTVTRPFKIGFGGGAQ